MNDSGYMMYLPSNCVWNVMGVQLLRSKGKTKSPEIIQSFLEVIQNIQLVSKGSKKSPLFRLSEQALFSQVGFTKASNLLRNSGGDIPNTIPKNSTEQQESTIEQTMKSNGKDNVQEEEKTTPPPIRTTTESPKKIGTKLGIRPPKKKWEAKDQNNKTKETGSGSEERKRESPSGKSLGRKSSKKQKTEKSTESKMN